MFTEKGVPEDVRVAGKRVQRVWAWGKDTWRMRKARNHFRAFCWLPRLDSNQQPFD